MRFASILVLLFCLFGTVSAQQWVVFGPNGTQTYPASAPYIFDFGYLFANRSTDFVTMYAYRAQPTPNQSPADFSCAAFSAGTSPAPSNLPQLLKIDNRFYPVQSPVLIGLSQEWLIGATGTNCRLPSGALPNAGEPGPTNALFVIGNTRIKFAPGSSIEVFYHPVADYIQITSIHGNMICDGEIPAPAIPFVSFRSGFESL